MDVPTLQDYVILDQNYPNPFNPETKIRFVINDNINVKLKVFDEIGSEIAEIFNDKVEPGKIYDFNFDGSLLSPGVYYYSLTAANYKEICKVLPLKQANFKSLKSICLILFKLLLLFPIRNEYFMFFMLIIISIYLYIICFLSVLIHLDEIRASSLKTVSFTNTIFIK